MNLTPKQMRTLIVLRDHIDRLGYAPTYEELGELLGCVKITAYEIVQHLIRKGAVESGENRWQRSLRLTEAGTNLLNQREANRSTKLRYMGEINGNRRTAMIVGGGCPLKIRGPIILGGFVPHSRLLTRFVRVRGGGHVQLPPLFIAPRPCRSGDAERLAVSEASRHGFGAVVVGASATAIPVARKGAA